MTIDLKHQKVLLDSQFQDIDILIDKNTKTDIFEIEFSKDQSKMYSESDIILFDGKKDELLAFFKSIVKLLEEN